MRRRPDLFSLLLVVAVAAGLAGSALAQSGAGAERYEVTISPPKRPGSEPEAAATPAGDAAGGAGDAAGSASDAAKSAAIDPAAGGGSAPASPNAPAAAPIARPAIPSGPPRTLQVAAFRQHDRADALRSELAGSFPDVAILEVQSGGEPLYRVNVGRLPKGPELDALKKRLKDAGHPSFDVAAPAKTAND